VLLVATPAECSLEGTNMESLVPALRLSTGPLSWLRIQILRVACQQYCGKQPQYSRHIIDYVAIVLALVQFTIAEPCYPCTAIDLVEL
jgi:hypothetical protein